MTIKFFFSSRLIINPEHAFGKEGNDKFGIPPNATVEYTVTLNEFEREIESWKLDAEESLAQAQLAKEKGTNFVKQEQYLLAIKLLEKANSFLSNCTSELNFRLQYINIYIYKHYILVLRE